MRYQGCDPILTSMHMNDPYDSQSHTTLNFSSENWSTGLCSCCSQDNCCNSWCFCLTASVFPYCAYGALLKDAGLVEDCVSASCVTWFLYSIPFLPQLVFCNLRSNVAEARGIKESHLENLLMVLCCFPCAMTQVYNDLVIQDYKFKRNHGMLNSIIGNVEDKTAFAANSRGRTHGPYQNNQISINSMYLDASAKNYVKGTCRCCTVHDCRDLCCSVCQCFSICLLMLGSVR
jgi:Cys-rich protein (TIGR01571 family)